MAVAGVSMNAKLSLRLRLRRVLVANPVVSNSFGGTQWPTWSVSRGMVVLRRVRVQKWDAKLPQCIPNAPATPTSATMGKWECLQQVGKSEKASKTLGR